MEVLKTMLIGLTVVILFAGILVMFVKIFTHNPYLIIMPSVLVLSYCMGFLIRELWGIYKK